MQHLNTSPVNPSPRHHAFTLVELLGEHRHSLLPVLGKANSKAPSRTVAELKSKNDPTVVLSSFYNGEIAVIKNSTGQQCPLIYD